MPVSYLANEAHYDCNDLGVGISIWMDRVQDHPTDGYFSTKSTCDGQQEADKTWCTN